MPLPLEAPAVNFRVLITARASVHISERGAVDRERECTAEVEVRDEMLGSVAKNSGRILATPLKILSMSAVPKIVQ
jgi:hypothetical protein